MVNYLAPAYVHVRSDENSRDVISNGSLRPAVRTDGEAARSDGCCHVFVSFYEL